MALTAFADSPNQMAYFVQSWGLAEAYTIPVSATCSGCEGALRLAMVTDVPLTGVDLHAYLVIELRSRGWSVKGRACRCPRCR